MIVTLTAAPVTLAQFQALLEQGSLLKRLPTLAEVADTAVLVASDRAAAITQPSPSLSAGGVAAVIERRTIDFVFSRPVSRRHYLLGPAQLLPALRRWCEEAGGSSE